jgi:hypothetical protein
MDKSNESADFEVQRWGIRILESKMRNLGKSTYSAFIHSEVSDLDCLNVSGRSYVPSISFCPLKQS